MSAQSKPPPVCLANSASPECKAVLRLKLARGMSSSAWNAIRESFGGAAGALCASAAAWQAARLAPQLRDAALGVTQRALQGLLTQLSDAGAHVLIWNDAAYPHLLSHLSDAPPVLFVRGELKPPRTRMRCAPYPCMASYHRSPWQLAGLTGCIREHMSGWLRRLWCRGASS